VHWVADSNRGMGTLAGRIGSGIPRLVLDILTGSGGTGFLLSIGAALPIAFFALVPKAFLLFRSPFFIAVLFCLSLPAVRMASETRPRGASPKVPESFKPPSCSTFYA
jgi:hypothetical protein